MREKILCEKWCVKMVSKIIGEGCYIGGKWQHVLQETFCTGPVTRQPAAPQRGTMRTAAPLGRTLCVLCLPATRKPVAAQRATTIAASRPGCSVLYLPNRYGPLTGDCMSVAPPVGTTRAANNQGSFYRGRFPGDFVVVSKSNVRQ